MKTENVKWGGNICTFSKIYNTLFVLYMNRGVEMCQSKLISLSLFFFFFLLILVFCVWWNGFEWSWCLLPANLDWLTHVPHLLKYPYQNNIMHEWYTHIGSVRWQTIECDCIYVQSSGHRWTALFAIRTKGKCFVFRAHTARFDVTGKLLVFFSGWAFSHQPTVSFLWFSFCSTRSRFSQFWLIPFFCVAEQMFHSFVFDLYIYLTPPCFRDFTWKWTKTCK